MIAIFYYHRVGPFVDGEPRRMSVTPENFAGQMRWLKRTGVPVHSLSALARPSPPRYGLVLTFDDGYADLMQYGLPVLRDLRLPATFFIVARRVGGQDEFLDVPGIPRRPLMDWTHLKELAAAGMDVGSHAMTHRDLTRLPVAEAVEEIDGSRKLLESRLGVTVPHFSYPYGRCDESLQRIVRESGYALACGTKSGDYRNLFRLQRIPISASDTLLQFAGKVLKGMTGYYRRWPKPAG